ncbi:hypothetical protein NUBL21994_14420 [Klebsiella pneumoniae]|nr:hypothetical protein NUBL21994_14420 [Klebsiella pneumoniae]
MKNTTATPWIQHPRFLKILYPTLVAVAMVLLWQGAVSYFRCMGPPHIAIFTLT